MPASLLLLAGLLFPPIVIECDRLSGHDRRSSMTETEINQKVAEQICANGQLNGTTFARGQSVALLDGQVVAVADRLETALKALRQMDPNPQRGMVFQVEPQMIDVIRRVSS